MNKQLIEDVFEETDFFYEIVSFKKELGSTEVGVHCNITTFEEINEFITSYMKFTNETLKIELKKKCTEKSIYFERIIYRCHHDTRYEKTRESKTLLTEKPMKRFRNTYCPFQMSIKVLKTCIGDSSFKCIILLEHTHNHSIKSLHALSFKCVSIETTSTINSLFASGMTPSQAYTEFIQNFRSSCIDDLDFHLKKADRSNCPRRTDFNALYIKFCEEHFGSRSGVEMFSLLEEKIANLKKSEEDLKIDYQPYDKEKGSALIIAIVTPFMCRVHNMVSHFFPGFLLLIKYCI